MKDIDVDPVAFLQNKTAVEDSLETFRSYSKKYLNDTDARLERFNSDFISRIRATLHNMQDTKAPKLIKSLESYVKQLDAVAQTFPKVDDALASQMGSKK